MLIHDEEPLENETDLPTPETKLTEEEKKMLNPEKEQHQVEMAPMPTSPAVGLPSKREGVATVADGVVLHQHDRRPPVFKLVQPTSSLGTPGKFRRADTEEEYDDLLAVPLRVQATRTKWGSGFSRDRLPECASDDGIESVTEFRDGRTPLFVARKCSSCGFFTTVPWMMKQGEEICQPGYSVLLMDLETSEVYGMRLLGTAAKLSRIFGAKSHLRRAVLKLWGEKASTEKGSWYQLKASVSRQLTSDELELTEEMYGLFGVEFDESPVA